MPELTNEKTDFKLSVRQAETVARFLREKGASKIAASACRWKTPEQVATMFLGSRAAKPQINTLARDICINALGMEL